MEVKHFCNYEHLSQCGTILTHRVRNYWVGEARKRFGLHAYFCSAHANEARHLSLEVLKVPLTRTSHDEATRNRLRNQENSIKASDPSAD